MRKISYANAGITIPSGYDTSINPWIGTTRTDWFKEIFRDAPYQRHTISLNYGTDKFKSRMTFNYQDNEGIIVKSYSKSLGLRYNASYKMNDWVTITENVNISHGRSRSSDTSSAYSGTIVNALYMPRSAEVFQSSGPRAGHYGGVFTEDPDYISTYGNYAALLDGENPYRLATDYNSWNGSTSIWSTTAMEIANIVKGLKFNTQFIYNLNYGMSKGFTYKVQEVGAVNLSNVLQWNASRSDTWRQENTLTYDRTFGKHTVGALGAVTLHHYNGRGFGLKGVGFADESEHLQYIKFVSDTKNVSGSDYYSGDDANIAFVGRLSYSYDDRYFLTASFRRDYAGRLTKGYEYGDFPAVTAAWKISSEPFFPKNDNINLLKLRASWGRIGNLGSIGLNYNTATLGSTYWNEGSIYGLETGSSWGTFWYPASIVNKELTWETSEQLDAGLDIDLFRDRLSISADIYNKRTFNLIQGQTAGWPQTIGFSAMLINQGEIANRGFEISATWKDKIGKDFDWFVTGNYSFNHNEVISTGVYDEDGNEAPWSGGGDWRMVPWLYQTEKGQPVNSFFVIKTDGIFQSEEDVYEHNKDGKLIQPSAQPGDLRFVDYNNDGKIDNSDRQYSGSTMPSHTFALTTGFNWKNFNFSMMFQGVAGNKIAYVAKQMILSDVEGNFNRSVDILDAWSPTNSHSNIPRLSKNDPNGNFTTASDYYLEDGSYIRLKNLTVGYDLTNLMRRIPHFAQRNSTCSVYFSGENVLTFTKYSGMDPEVGGRDTMTYPVSRIFALGLKLNY